MTSIITQKDSLHKTIAIAFDAIIKQYKPMVSIEKDKACNGTKSLTFFISFIPSRESAISQVDLIVLKNEKIILVCEIEESGFHPGKLFGKLFSTASAKICRLVVPTGHQYLEFDENAIFVQIVSTESFNKDKSFKVDQGQLIENEIFNKLTIYNSWITKYRLLFGDINDFAPGKKGFTELERVIKPLL